MLYRKILLWLSCFAALALPAASVRVRFGSEVAFLGDRLTMQVLSDDTVLRDARFVFSRSVRPVGGRSSSMQVINGRGSSSLTYTLMPAGGEGEYRLESLTAVDAEGNTLTFDGHPTFTVKAPTADPDVSFTAEADATEIYPGDAVTVTLTVEAPGLVYDGEVLPPFSGGAPGLAMPAEFEEEAALRLEGRGGRWQNTVVGKGRLRQTLQLKYRAVRAGTADFGTPMLRDDRILSVRRERTFFGEQRLVPDRTVRSFAFAEPLRIRVVMPPTEGRPEGYTGAIATAFAAEASTDTNRASVGDPLKLTVLCRTDSTGSTLRAPALPPIPGMRPYGEAKCETLRDGVRMDYLLRPTQPGLLEIPPLTLSWYDRAKRTYRTVTTGAVPVRVLASAQMLLDGLNADRTPPPLVTATAPQPSFMPDRRMLWVPGAALLLLVLRWAVRLLRAPLAKLRERRRKRTPVRAAMAALSAAETAAEAVAAVRVWAGRPALTASELARRLPDSPEAAEAVRAFASLEQAAYGGQADVSDARRTLLRVLPGLRRALRVLILLALPLTAGVAGAAGASEIAGVSGASETAGASEIAGAAGASGAAEAAEPADMPSAEAFGPTAFTAEDAAFLREEAVARSLGATEQKDYAAAANCWLRLAQHGDLSRPVLMNAASCALLAGAPSSAKALYERCAWLHGPDAEVRRGLSAAADRLREAEPSLRRVQVLRGSGLFGADALCLSAGVLLVLLALPRRRRLMRRLVLLAAVWTLAEGIAFGVLMIKAYGAPLPAPIEAAAASAEVTP